MQSTSGGAVEQPDAGRVAGRARKGSEPAREGERLQQDAREIEQRPFFRRLTRGGLAARAVIYALIAGIALEIGVRGSASAQANTQGAFEEVARQPGGRALLAVLAAGLAAYAGWRLVGALAGDPGPRRGGIWHRLGSAASGCCYLFLCTEAARLLAGAAAGQDVSSNPGLLVTPVLRWPGGPVLVGVAGASLGGSGAALGIWGVAHDYGNLLQRERLGRRGLRLARALGAAGDVARGLLLGLVAGYLFYAAASDDPRHAKGLSAALQQLAHQPAGPFLLGLLAAGLLCFAGYSLLEARYRRELAPLGGARPASRRCGRAAPGQLPKKHPGSEPVRQPSGR